jgi:hypothetical protein
MKAGKKSKGMLETTEIVDVAVKEMQKFLDLLKNVKK